MAGFVTSPAATGVGRARGPAAINPFAKTRPCVSTSRTKRCRRLPTRAELKESVQIVRDLEELVGPDRGVFGIASEASKQRVSELIAELETGKSSEELALGTKTNPFPLVYGSWRVIYTSLEILGRNRSVLGLKPRSNGKSAVKAFGVVQLGELMQTVRPDGTASSSVGFKVLLGGIEGFLEIDASFSAEEGFDGKRVRVESEAWGLEPSKAEKLLGERNIELLLSIFDPSGYLDITYVDDDVRVGRDDKGLVYVLERCTPESAVPDRVAEAALAEST